MSSLKKNLIKYYGINNFYSNLILSKFGLASNIKSYKFKYLSLVQDIKTLVSYFFLKREQLKKLKWLNINVKIKNGSYYGYKRIRGLPMYNQLTRVNSKTSRKFKSN